MLLVLKKYFVLFIVYSFIGWIMEIIWTLATERKLINRGFLIGPYCPIYGCGCLLLIILLDRYKNDIVVLFIMSIIICSVLEYFTSYLMEKIFKARWWDYSHYKFNLNGRICVQTMVPFGVLGVLVVYFLNPFLVSNININSIIVSIILFLFIVDIIISFSVISNLRSTITNIASDNTEEITKRVKEVLIKKSILHKRLVKAFPSFKSPIDRLKEFVKK